MKSLLLLVLLVQDPVEEKPAPKELQAPEKEVVIIGQRRESDILDVPSGVTVITQKQIRESGQTTVVEVLRLQPGFFSSGFNRGSADQVLDLRGYNNGGGNGQRTLVLVDGRKTNSVVGSTTDWGQIPLDNVERIEVVRGPAAAMYGDPAVAGVVNIITQKGGKNAVSTVSASGGSWNSYRGVANVAGGSDEVRYDLFVGTEGTNGYRDHSKFDARNFTGRVEGPLNETLAAYAKLGYHEDERERPGSLSKADIEAINREASVLGGSPSENETWETYADLGFTQSLEDLGILEVFLNHTEGEGDTVFMSTFGDFYIEDDSSVSQGQFKHVIEPEFFGNIATITTGLDLSYEKAHADSGTTPSVLSESDYRRRLIGAFTHLELRPVDFVILSGSIRFDRALLDLDNDPAGGGGFDRQRDFNEWSPHAGATVRVLEELSLYGSYGRTFRFPTRDELIGFFTGTPFLDPENAETYEAGVRVWARSWGSGSITVYHSEVDDEIFFDSTTFTSMNFEQVTHRGVESEVRITPAEWVDVFGTHTYTSARITESVNPALEDKRYPVTPRFQGAVGVTLRYVGATVTAMSRYVGTRYLINDVTNAGPDLGSYVTYDARVEYAWEKVSVFLAGYNLAGRETFDNGGLTGGGPRYSPNAERSFLAGADVRF